MATDGTGESVDTMATASILEQAMGSPVRTMIEVSPWEEAVILMQDVVPPEEPHGARAPFTYDGSGVPNYGRVFGLSSGAIKVSGHAGHYPDARADGAGGPQGIFRDGPIRVG